MKNIFTIILISGFSLVQAQVAIDKNFTGNSSVLLEFNDTRDAAIDENGSTVDVGGVNKTIILPTVSTIDANSTEGTIWLDAADDKIKYKTAGQLPNGDVIDEIVEMTSAGSDENSPISLDSSLTQVATSQGVIIGDPSTAKGALILESTDKAMVLPVVESVNAIVQPEAGSLVYDKTEKAIAVFNGSEWYFWGNY